MSIKIMSAIFETEFPDYLTDGGEAKTKASTAKLILLAIADHANDEGESAYPGLTRLERKTGLSRQGLVDAIKILKYNGLITVSDEPSKLHTNNYTLNLSAYPVLVNPLDQSSHLTITSQPTLPALVKPLDLNHQLTTNKPSPQLPENSDTSWLIAAGVNSTEIARLNEKEEKEKGVAARWEREMSYNPLPWWTDKNLGALLRFLMDKTEDEVKTFAAWSRKEFSPLSPTQARKNPRLVIDLWQQAFPVKEPEKKHRHFHTEPDGTEVWEWR